MAGDDRHDASCFADEVAIDFPSVATALARIRRAFLADERPARLSTTIRLSGREARTGTTLPLDVPVHCLCRNCGGRGESWTERCPRCNGSGAEVVRQALHVTLPAGVIDGARFHFTVTPHQNITTRIELQVFVS
jgi:DnaJ-class molecular chaperone